MLVMKRMIRYAAENGYDRIAWTTGESVMQGQPMFSQGQPALREHATLDQAQPALDPILE